MRLSVLLSVFLLLVSCSGPGSEKDSELQALYAILDEEIARSKEYEEIKENRISRLRDEFHLAGDERRRTEIIDRLISEFDAYNSDSALCYVSLNLRRPAAMGIPGEHTRLMIKRADVLAHAGLFSDALEIMRNIPRDSLGGQLLEEYYFTYCATCQYLCEYANEHEAAADYEKRRALYADSLCQVATPGSFNHVVYAMPELVRKGDYDTAISTLATQLGKYRPGTREYSILASILAYTYKTAGNTDEYKRYLVRSAISDARGAVKENMSFREVATVMFEDGDIERANRYLKKSIADANFYSALMRNVQSSKMLPVIDSAYSSLQSHQNRRLRGMMLASIVLSCALAIAMLLIVRQFKRLRIANAKVNDANGELRNLSDQLKTTNRQLQAKNQELSGLSDELRAKNQEMSQTNEKLNILSGRLKLANEELEDRNDELVDLNHTKEQYAGLFMEYCSSAISSLHHYQQSLRILTAQGANRDTLMKKLESSEIADQLLRNFYVRFDDAVLKIYPSFVDKFNALLNPDEQVVLKSGELLNTELRLFALIRLGIDDSAKIAKFLRCSISTVYTYRSKMRKRAADPDKFENNVRNLG